MKNRSLSLAVLLLCLALLVNAQDKAQMSEVEQTSTQKTETLVRPANIKSLRQFVKRNFAGKYDAESLQETTSNGNPAITFSFTEGEKTTDGILIDNGNSLELNTDTYPTMWKFSSDNTPQDAGYEFPPPDNILAASVPTCGGLASSGNPYPCCSVNGRSGYGNCTFAAWYHAKRFWGYSLPGWSHAKTWFDSATSARLPISPTPALYAIGVNSTLASGGVVYGHVAWIMEISNNMVLGYEQNCGSTASGVQQKWWSTSTFNKGYILSPVSAPSPTVALAANSPLYSNNTTQAVRFNVTNVNLGARAVVIFPNGGRATLKDAQLSLSGNTLTAYMVLNARGQWKIQMFNENGKYSGLATFTVN